MSLHWHVPLPGPVSYSRPVRKRKKTGGLTGLLVWFIVTPFKLLAKGLGLAAKSRPRTPVGAPRIPAGVNAQIWPAPGWYWWGEHGYVFFDGRRWTHDFQGRVF